MTKLEFKKKWAPKVKNTSGTKIVDGWEEDLESMIQSETRYLNNPSKSNLPGSINRDYPGTKD